MSILREPRHPFLASWNIPVLAMLLALLTHDTTVALASHGLDSEVLLIDVTLDQEMHAARGAAAVADGQLPSDVPCTTGDPGVLSAGWELPDDDAGEPAARVVDRIVTRAPGPIPHPFAIPPDVRRALIQVWLN